MRSADEFDTVRRLIAGGLTDSAIARRTGIPRCTVRDWRCRPQIRARTWAGSPCAHDFSRLPAKSYSYLLGIYLGDGCISEAGRVWRLRIVLDDKYPGIIEYCRAAIETVMPGQHAAILRRRSNCTEVSLHSKHWPCLLPQHGPGRKHLRPIRLHPWQEELVRVAPEDFLRGLIHSDGCRVVANDRGVRSVRYHFSNRSDDIRALYCAALDQLGIPWTRPRWFDVAVYRKAAVARLDEFIGPKV
jgi:hypothetical protein